METNKNLRTDTRRKFEQKPKKSENNRPQDGIWSLPSWAHVHCHVVLWTQRTIPDSHHPWGSCTPPNHNQTHKHTQLLNFLGKQTIPTNWNLKKNFSKPWSPWMGSRGSFQSLSPAQVNVKHGENYGWLRLVRSLLDYWLDR